jgi:hypothetical protein
LSGPVSNLERQLRRAGSGERKKIMKTNPEKASWAMPRFLLLPALLVAAGLLVGGCESDSVVPHDNLPAVTQDEAAQQAALAAMAAAQVGPEIVRFQGNKLLNKALGVYTHTMPPGADVQGTVTLEFFDGGPGGVHSSWEDADYALLYTSGDTGITVDLESGGGFGLTFDVTALVDRPADTATISGGGIFTTGDLASTFSFTDLVVTAVSSYPTGGTMGFTSGSHELVIHFDGDQTAVIMVDSTDTYIIDLAEGSVTEI